MGAALRVAPDIRQFVVARRSFGITKHLSSRLALPNVRRNAAHSNPVRTP
jgi:hypothetical protein